MRRRPLVWRWRNSTARVPPINAHRNNLRTLTSDEELSVLLKAYELERLDDLQMAGAFLALLAPTLGLLSLMGFALINAASIPKWRIALVPIAPLPFIAFGAIYSQLATVRGALLDGYERALQGAASNLVAGGLAVPSGHHVLGRVWNSVYSRVVIGISAVALGSLYVAAIAVAFRDARTDEPALAWFGLIFSSVCTLVLCLIYVLALWPERIIRKHSADIRRD